MQSGPHNPRKHETESAKLPKDIALQMVRARAFGYKISAISLAIGMNQLICDLSAFLLAGRVLNPI